MIFEEHVITQEKWHRSYSWQMTLRLGLSEPPCEMCMHAYVCAWWCMYMLISLCACVYGFCMSGCMSAWVHGCMSAWVHECMHESCACASLVLGQAWVCGVCVCWLCVCRLCIRELCICGLCACGLCICGLCVHWLSVWELCIRGLCVYAIFGRTWVIGTQVLLDIAYFDGRSWYLGLRVQIEALGTRQPSWGGACGHVPVVSQSGYEQG